MKMVGRALQEQSGPLDRWFSRPLITMFIIYLDESGTHAEARYFVVAGLAVFEQDTHFLAEALDRLQDLYFPDESNPVPFHMSDLRAPASRRRPPYDSLTDEKRRTLIADVYRVLATSRA